MSHDLPSPARLRALARVAGVLYLLNIVLGAWGEVGVRQRVLAADAMTTAANLRAMEPLWRLGIAANLVLLATGVPLLIILYILLRPAGRTLALLAASFCLVGIAVETTTLLRLIDATLLMGTDPSLRSFTAPQLAALASLAIRAHTLGFGVSLVFYASYQVTAGILIVRSKYLPAFVGVMMQLGGIGYLANNFALILAPSVTRWLFPVSAVPALLGELSLCLWLLVKGVDAERWLARSASSRVIAHPELARTHAGPAAEGA